MSKEYLFWREVRKTVREECVIEADSLEDTLVERLYGIEKDMYPVDVMFWYKVFELIGDMWQPFTYGQKAWAFHIALKFGIKLIMYGENGELEYGGVDKYKNLPKEGVEEWEKNYFRGNIVDKFINIGLERKVFRKEEINC